MNFFIYGLRDPRTLEIRYVGKTEKGMYRPLRHLGMARHEQTPKAMWVKELSDSGLQYEVLVLESFETSAPLDEAERAWIARGRAIGWPLLNRTSGGQGSAGRSVSTETRAKIAAAHLGVRFEEGKYSMGRVRPRPTEEARRKMRDAALKRGRAKKALDRSSPAKT